MNLEYGSVEECLLSMKHVCVHSVFLACLTSTSSHLLCFHSLLISLLLVFSIGPLHYSTEVIYCTLILSGMSPSPWSLELSGALITTRSVFLHRSGILHNPLPTPLRP